VASGAQDTLHVELLKGLSLGAEISRGNHGMNAPLSRRIRCMFSGHDWRTAIGPRSGYYERCRHCYATREISESSEIPPAERSDMQRSGRSGAEQPASGEKKKKKSGSDERAA
jgi:hypothetical protein